MIDAVSRMCSLASGINAKYRIGMPRVGCGIGGLRWDVLRPMLTVIADQYPTVELIVFTPEGA